MQRVTQAHTAVVSAWFLRLGPLGLRRVDREGEVATASTLSRMISAVPVTPGGPARFLIFDIHALQIRLGAWDEMWRGNGAWGGLGDFGGGVAELGALGTLGEGKKGGGPSLIEG